jgi:hypothetical protein
VYFGLLITLPSWVEFESWAILLNDLATLCPRNILGLAIMERAGVLLIGIKHNLHTICTQGLFAGAYL